MLRQTMSAMLEHADAVERSMELFHRRGNLTELDRAASSYDAMLAHVDRLGELLRSARRENRQEVADKAA
jgi:hypothetical protein